MSNVYVLNVYVKRRSNVYVECRCRKSMSKVDVENRCRKSIDMWTCTFYHATFNFYIYFSRKCLCAINTFCVFDIFRLLPIPSRTYADEVSSDENEEDEEEDDESDVDFR